MRLESAGNTVAAPAPGVEVTLTTGNAGCLAAVSPVTIGTGFTSTTSGLTYGGSSSLPCTTTLTASSPGLTPETLNVTVNPNPVLTLSSLPATVGAGLQDGGYSGSLGESNHGGVTVHLASSDGRLLVARNANSAGTASIDIAVPDGQASFSYYIQGLEGSSGDATLTATAPGFSSTSGLVHVVAPAVELQSLPTTTTTLSANTDFYARIGLANSNNTGLNALQAIRTGSSALTVTITNQTAAVAQLTTLAGTAQTRTVSIGPGLTNSPTVLANGGIQFDPIAAGATQVSATAPGFTALTTATRSVTVSAPGVTLGSLPATVGAGLQDGVYTGSLGGSNHGGVTVQIASSDGRVLLAQNATSAGAASINIPVANGNTSFSYYIQGLEGSPGDATITVTAPGFSSASGLVHVVAPAVELQSVPATTTTLSANTDFYARIGLGNANNTGLNALQAVRLGGSPLTVTITNQAATVAQLTTLAGTAQTRTVTIGPGQTNSPTVLAKRRRPVRPDWRRNHAGERHRAGLYGADDGDPIGHRLGARDHAGIAAGDGWSRPAGWRVHRIPRRIEPRRGHGADCQQRRTSAAGAKLDQRRCGVNRHSPPERAGELQLLHSGAGRIDR